MSHESPQSLTPETPEEILAFEDKEILNFTLHKFQEYLTGLEKEKMPAIIIFPETSTRPLLYAIKPVIEKIYKDKGMEIPDYRYITTLRSPEREEFGISDDVDQEKAETLRKEIIDLKTPPMRGPTPHSFEEVKRQLSERKILMKKVPEKRREYQKEAGWHEARKRRFEEIIEKSQRGNILVVDDFINSYESLDQIEEFRSLVPEGNSMEYYILIDIRDQSKDESNRKYDDKIHTALHQLDYRLLSGSSLWAFDSFSYAGRPVSPWEAQMRPVTTKEDKQAMMGVSLPYKPEMYSKIVQPADPARMKKLREEMSQVGQKVADSPVFDEEEWKKSLPYHIPDSFF